LALDKTSGWKKFYICHGDYGMNPIFEFHSSLLKPTEAATTFLMGPVQYVRSLSLSDFCSNHQIEKIDMLWLSTEGNELQILEGAQTLLDGVSLVFARSMLSMTRESMTTFDALKSFMEKNGFILLSHFYSNWVNGDALFVREKIFRGTND
jgi:hypothetical protein